MAAKIEYLWTDGEAKSRLKCVSSILHKEIEVISDIPRISVDKENISLIPYKLYKNPLIRKLPGFIVLCNEPIWAIPLNEGEFLQRYSFMSWRINQPLGWHKDRIDQDCSYDIANQDIVDEYLAACVQAKINITYIYHSEGLGQWQYIIREKTAGEGSNSLLINL